MSVAVVLVCHDGARWLSQVVAGLRAQTVLPDRVVVVDTGSRDDSLDLVRDLGVPQELRQVSWNASFPEAVAAGVEGLDTDWVWLLHDDSTPEAGALERLLAAAEQHPDADFLGPKLREWPSLKRLLEVGATLSFTGRRETGLERGEYDQGQHDVVRRVLAVQSAGMLARREALVALGGFDRDLPIFGNDLDLGWRAAWAGHHTMVVPQAVVFHAEAAARGVRRTGLTGRNTTFHMRRAALFTLFANVPTHLLLWLWLRITFGSLLRALGYLVTRAPRLAQDELSALTAVILQPGRIHAARRRRKPGRTAPWSDVRGLLAPWWLPYRHGLDFVSDVVVAATNQAQDVAERRRAAAGTVTVRNGGGSEDEDDLEDTGWVVRFLTNPVAVLSALFVVLALIGAREAWHGHPFGALSAAPARATDWWRLYAEHTHALLQGSTVPAPAFVLPLALLASLMGGSTSLAIGVLMVLAVPLGFWGAFRFLRVVGHAVDPRGAPGWLLAAGAAGFALVPAVSGAWGEGRFGTVVAGALLPWLAHAGLGLADPEAARRWRAAWRTALLLALITAFAPMAFVFCLLFAGVGLVLARVVVRDALRQRSAWGPPVLALVLVPVLLLPYIGPLLWGGPRSALLLEAGRLPEPSPSFWELLTGRLGPESGPAWLGALVLVGALLALVPRRTRIPVLGCWITAAVGALIVALLSPVRIQLASTSTHVGLGFFAVLFEGVLLVAAVIGAAGIVRGGLGVRLPARVAQAVVPAIAAAMLLVPVAGTLWFVQGHHAAPSTSDSAVPAYMVQEAKSAPGNGVLVMSGTVEQGVGFVVHRGQGEPVGADQIVALTPEDKSFTADVTALVSRPTPQVVKDLASAGIEYIVLRSPADGRVAATLDAATGLEQASIEDPLSRAWKVVPSASSAQVASRYTLSRWILLVLQVAAIALALVMAPPPLRSDRDD